MTHFNLSITFGLFCIPKGYFFAETSPSLPLSRLQLANDLLQAL